MPKPYRDIYRFRVRKPLWKSDKQNLKKWPEMERSWNESQRDSMREFFNRKNIIPNKMYCWIDHKTEEKICDMEIRADETDKFVFWFNQYYRDWSRDFVEPPATVLNLNAHRKLKWKR